MSANLNGNISINIALDAPPIRAAAFSFPLFIAASITLGGSDRVRVYDSGEAAEDDVANLSAAVVNAVKVVFAQERKPSAVKIARKAAEESYAEALTAARLADDVWYTVGIDSRANADIAAISSAIESTKKLAILQSGEATLLTNSPDAALTNIFTRERSTLIYHDSATQYADLGWAANRLAFDPGSFSAPWDTPIQGVNPYTTALTATQKTQAQTNNVNVMLPYGSEPTFVDAGVNAKGRPIYELVTRDWFEAELFARMAALKAALSKAGQKLTLDRVGQQRVLALIYAVYREGLAAGHFTPDALALFEPAAITETDLQNQRLRFTGRARLAVGGRLFVFDLAFTRLLLN